MTQIRDSVSLTKAALDTVNGDRDRLALGLGVTVHAVRQWISGRRRPGFEATQRLLAMIRED